MLRIFVERFEDDATDYMVLFVASAIVTRTRNTHLQFKVLTALWCYYGRRDPVFYGSSQKDLITWFTYSLFGRHATPHEVTMWTLRCTLRQVYGPESAEGAAAQLASPTLPSGLLTVGHPPRHTLLGDLEAPIPP